MNAPQRSLGWDAGATTKVELGATLRAARTARGLSLVQVAEATGISRSLLSLIETGRSDITIGRLIRLGELYGIHPTELIGPPATADPAVVRRSERRVIELREEGIELELLAPDSSRKFLPLLAGLEPGGRGTAEPLRHPGEEFVHVLEGTIRLELEGAEPVVLEAGDSAYYSSERGHRWINVGEGRARLLNVATPPPL